jgi:microsomal epoxide hydrolase
MNLREYRIHVEDAALDDLKARLLNTRWPEQIEGAGWGYGADLGYVRELCRYWRQDYDWRRVEARLNALPQYTCRVDGVDIRFWHLRSGREDAIPLLLLHGWPGSAYEFFDMIEPLARPEDPGAPAFDAIAPCLPGFGFSGKPSEPGWGCLRMAQALDGLMRELGYGRYAVQGGDWGAMIAARMGDVCADRLIGIHINFPNIPIPVPDEEYAALSEGDRRALVSQAAFDAREGAYHLIQETKPDALTLAQTDSPAGLCAWIVEKFRTWSDCGGDLESVYTKDRLLTNIMFYWAPASVASAARLYYESYHDPAAHWGAPDPHIKAPTAVAFFPRDPFNRPEGWVRRHFNVVRWREMPAGGHFAAMEKPALLLGDIREAFGGMLV